MRKLVVILLMAFSPVLATAQGFYNHVWLTGNNPFAGFPNGRIVFDSLSYVHAPEMRKMSFKGTEATICDAQGNFLMSSNGVWIANANNDTMMNGTGLNPNGITGSWPYGLPITSNNVIIPFPDDSNKYVLFHHTATLNGPSYTANELYYSLINMTLDNSLGGVVLKNTIALNDTMSWGIGCCKHANGRDWWIFMIKHNSSIVNILLFTPAGIVSVTQQQLNVPIAWYSSSQIGISNNGDKISYVVYEQNTINSSIIIADFDRCTGVLSNDTFIVLTQNEYLWGLTFSPSDKYIYTCSSSSVFQINTDSLTSSTVANYDGFISPGPSCCATSFWNMYLAANGKIYITSGSSVQHLHEMNYPDSAGIACDVQQHAIDLGSYLHLRAVPNHPNYNLGPVVGSVCDSLSVGLHEQGHDFRFGISPNPTGDGYVKLVYLLPQNMDGVFEVYDMTGQLVYKMNLPPWSTLQYIHLPELSNGVYTCVIKSGFERVGKKLVVMR